MIVSFLIHSFSDFLRFSTNPMMSNRWTPTQMSVSGQLFTAKALPENLALSFAELSSLWAKAKLDSRKMNIFIGTKIFFERKCSPFYTRFIVMYVV